MNKPPIAREKVVFERSFKKDRFLRCTSFFFCDSASQPEDTAIQQNEEDNDDWNDDGIWYQRYRSDNQEKVVEAVKGNDHERDRQCRCRPLFCHKQSNYSQ